MRRKRVFVAGEDRDRPGEGRREVGRDRGLAGTDRDARPHGRVTTWKCEQTAYIGWFADKDKWAGPRSVARIETETFRQKTGATTRDERYFISSPDVDPERALQAARSHWDVESGQAACHAAGRVAGKRRKIETHGAGAPCEKEKESGARDSLPLRGLHKAKGAPRPPGIGGWLLVVDC